VYEGLATYDDPYGPHYSDSLWDLNPRKVGQLGLVSSPNLVERQSNDAEPENGVDVVLRGTSSGHPLRPWLDEVDDPAECDLNKVQSAEYDSDSLKEGVNRQKNDVGPWIAIPYE
jgi:hypothetical protein